MRRLLTPKQASPHTPSVWTWNLLQFSSVQSLSSVRIFATPWTAAHQASLSITNSQSLLKLMSIELVMPSIHLILCHPLLLPPSILPSIRIFSDEIRRVQGGLDHNVAICSVSRDLGTYLSVVSFRVNSMYIH